MWTPPQQFWVKEIAVDLESEHFCFGPFVSNLLSKNDFLNLKIIQIFIIIDCTSLEMRFSFHYF